MRYNFKFVLSTPTPSHCHQKLSTTSTRAMSAPPLLSCHPLPNRPVLCPLPPSSCCVVRCPIALPLSAHSPLALHLPPPPSHCVVCRPPTFLFDCCVLYWRSWDVVANPMSCVVCPFPLTMLSAARLLRVL